MDVRGSHEMLVAKCSKRAAMPVQVWCAALRCSGADHGTARDDTDKPILSSSTGSQMLQNGPELNRHGKENGPLWVQT